MFPPCRISGWRQLLLLLLVLGAGQQLGAAGLIKAKAWLAPVLIERAWAQSLGLGGMPVKPWPWADTWPVARLRVPARGVQRLVLAGILATPWPSDRVMPAPRRAWAVRDSR